MPGWVSFCGVLERDQRVVGYRARRVSIKGLCNGSKGCRRTVHLEPTELCQAGLGELAMKQVQDLWKCSRVDGCRIDWHVVGEERLVRLSDLLGRPNVRIRIRCKSDNCPYVRTWKVEEFIAGLEKRQQGSDHTSTDQLTQKMTRACPRCKRVQWAVEVLWANTDTMNWKMQGERSLDRR